MILNFETEKKQIENTIFISADNNEAEGEFETVSKAVVSYSFNPKDVFLKIDGYFFDRDDLMSLRNFIDYALTRLPEVEEDSIRSAEHILAK